MINQLLVKFDRFLMINSYRLPYKYSERYSFPTKRLVSHCLTQTKYNPEYIFNRLAYEYCCSLQNRETVIKSICVKENITRERLRQLLSKFIRINL